MVLRRIEHSMRYEICDRMPKYRLLVKKGSMKCYAMEGPPANYYCSRKNPKNRRSQSGSRLERERSKITVFLRHAKVSAVDGCETGCHEEATPKIPSEQRVPEVLEAILLS